MRMPCLCYCCRSGMQLQLSQTAGAVALCHNSYISPTINLHLFDIYFNLCAGFSSLEGLHLSMALAMTTIIYYSLCLPAIGTIAAPTSSWNTTSDIVHWEQEPNGRGTWGVLSTCTITMVLCVYTALHLNLPPPNPLPEGTSTWTRLSQSRSCRQVRWMLMALLAPELVVFTAWTQRKAAIELTEAMSARLKAVSVYWVDDRQSES